MTAQSAIPTSLLPTLQAIQYGDVPMGPGLGKLKYWRSAQIGAGTNAETDSQFDLPAKGLVTKVWLEVTTAEVTGSTKTMDVGLLSSESGGDADAFIDGASVAATGLIQPNWVATVGLNNTYLGAAATHTFGAKLTGLLIAGEDTAAGGDGFASVRPFSTGSLTAKSVSYSRGDTFVEFRGYIWIEYIELP